MHSSPKTDGCFSNASRVEFGKDPAADFIFRIALLSQTSIAMKVLSFCLLLLAQRDDLLFIFQTLHFGFDSSFVTTSQKLISYIEYGFPSSTSFRASSCIPATRGSGSEISLRDFISLLISQSEKGNKVTLGMLRFFYNFLYASRVFVLENSAFLSSLLRDNSDISFSTSDFTDLVELFTAGFSTDAPTSSDSLVVQ